MRRALGALCPLQRGIGRVRARAMAYLELSLVIARAIWYFDFKMATDVGWRGWAREPGQPLLVKMKDSIVVEDEGSSPGIHPA